jgi:uncharacterized protein (DUF2235 family)
MYGLIGLDNDALVPYAIRMMMGIQKLRSRRDPASPIDPRVKQYFALTDDFKATFAARKCKPWFVGIWDTVSSVGWIANPLKLPFTASNPDIQIGRHAVAIDEHRAFFRSNLWHPTAAQAGPKDMKQVWFPGVHCDVGGGYPEAESGLSKIALEWMIEESRASGLLFDDEKVALVLGKRGQGYVPPDPDAEMHDSLKGAWRIAEFIPKRHWDEETRSESWRINNFHRRNLGIRPCVHDAAFERGGNYASTRLPADAVRLSSGNCAQPI